MDNKDTYFEEKITYFKKAGPSNTNDTLRLALERAKVRGISKIVLASTWGATARKAAELFAGTGLKMVVVPHQYGASSDTTLFATGLIPELERQGHRVHFGTMLFHTDNFYGVGVSGAMAMILRTLCQGMKVCVEIALMAADGGQVTIGEKVIVIAGTGRGADTAVVAKVSTSNRIHELHITEIICKPLESKSFMPGKQPPMPSPDADTVEV